MAISKTDMLAGFDKMHHEVVAILHDWITKESDNLGGFIDNPAEHVNYNRYMSLNYSKLTERQNLLLTVRDNLYTIKEYKDGNPDYTRSMYEEAIEYIPPIILARLLNWMSKEYQDMTDFLNSSGNPDDTAPLADYEEMFSFNEERFKAEYQVYVDSIEGCQVVLQYKKEMEAQGGS